MFHLIMDEGYGTHRLANWLNERGIKTKRGTTLWRDTSIRSLLSNPIYMGVIRFGKERSQPFERLTIIDEPTYTACLEMIHHRSPMNGREREIPLRTDARGLLTGLLFCKECGARLAFNHNTTKKRLANGFTRIYERDLYRCYRKPNSKSSCTSQSSYSCDKLNDAVKADVRQFFLRVKGIPKSNLLADAVKRSQAVAQIAYDRALAEYKDAQESIDALEEQAMLTIKGKGKLNFDMISSLQTKYQDRLTATKIALDDARTRLEDERLREQCEEAKLQKVLSWAECFDMVNLETQHMILATLIEKIEVGSGYKLTIYYRLTSEQFYNGKSDDASQISA